MGIGTGLNYAKLASELHSGNGSNYIKGDQVVHYMGIPVQVNYNVIQKGLQDMLQEECCWRNLYLEVLQQIISSMMR
jgi:hypothetical protein